MTNRLRGQTPEEFRAEMEAIFQSNPTHQLRRQMIIQFAESQGGLVMQYWRLKWGYLWGEPACYSKEECAMRLGVAVEELDRIDTMYFEEVHLAWRSHPQFDAREGTTVRD